MQQKKRMPVLFIGHGSPMNAIESNIYTESWGRIGKSIEKPRAILMFSAHWITEGETRISTREKAEMIYDMYGFPPELYRVRYDAPGSSEIANEIYSVLMDSGSCHTDAGSICPKNERKSEQIPHFILRSSPTENGSSEGQKPPKITPDPTRGYDHGVWSTLIHLFPAADIPVITMSLDYRATPESLIALGIELRSLRDQGILIVGSGNIVHNLGAIDWSGKHIYPWAIEFDKKVTNLIESLDHDQLLDFKNWGEISRLAHPSYDHLLPLFPLLGASSPDDTIEFFTPDIVMGSLSMRSMMWRTT